MEFLNTFVYTMVYKLKRVYNQILEWQEVFFGSIFPAFFLFRPFFFFFFLFFIFLYTLVVVKYAVQVT